MGSKRLAGEEAVPRTRREVFAMAAAGLTVWTAPQILAVEHAHAMGTTIHGAQLAGSAGGCTPAGWPGATGGGGSVSYAGGGTQISISIPVGCTLDATSIEYDCLSTGSGADPPPVCTSMGGGGTVGPATVVYTIPVDGTGLPCLVLSARAVFSCIGS